MGNQAGNSAAHDLANAHAALRWVVGVTALVAPALHSLTDILEWLQAGFSSAQLWLNYVAFVPMTWLLLGIYAVQERKPGVSGLVGALLYGAAFTYFAHTTLLALSTRVSDYELLWKQLGQMYTVHGGLMILGGLSFAGAAWRAQSLPKLAIGLFATGLAANLVLSALPVPDILQTIGSTLRNAGLMLMGYHLVGSRPAG